MQIKAEEISQIIKGQIKDYETKVDLSETGVVLSAGDGIARVYGLEKVKAMELVEFPGGILGLALNLEADNVGVAILGDDKPEQCLRRVTAEGAHDVSPSVWSEVKNACRELVQ